MNKTKIKGVKDNQHKTSHPSPGREKIQVDTNDLNPKPKKKPKRYNQNEHPERTANNLSNKPLQNSIYTKPCDKANPLHTKK